MFNKKQFTQIVEKVKPTNLYLSLNPGHVFRNAESLMFTESLPPRGRCTVAITPEGLAAQIAVGDLQFLQDMNVELSLDGYKYINTPEGVIAQSIDKAYLTIDKAQRSLLIVWQPGTAKLILKALKKYNLLQESIYLLIQHGVYTIDETKQLPGEQLPMLLSKEDRKEFIDLLKSLPNACPDYSLTDIDSPLLSMNTTGKIYEDVYNDQPYKIVHTVQQAADCLNAILDRTSCNGSNHSLSS